MINKVSNFLLILAVGGVLMFAGSATAQTSTDPAQQPAAGPGVQDPGHPRVNQVDNRLERQKQRIERGEKNGTITKQEAHHLYRHDQKVLNQENRAMAANGGHLTKREQRHFNKELSHNSRQIQRAEHN